MPDTSFEVIIVGGGPAGLFAGIVCSRNGLRTLVLEKQVYPIDKPCGEGIMPSGVVHLGKLGVSPFVEERAHHPFAGIRYVSGKGRKAEAKFKEGPGWGIQRTVLSSALRACVGKHQNLELRTEVNPECTWGDSPQVRLNHLVLRPKLLIGADGLHSDIRKSAGLEGPRSRLKRWGVRQHFRAAPWSRFVEIHWGPGLEAYVTPVSESSVNVNFLWDAECYKPRHAGKKLFGALLREFPELQARLENAEVLDEVRAVGPLHRQPLGVTKQNVLLLGDAAGFFDPITGEGISLAAKQALFLEKLVVPALMRKQESLQKELIQYAQAYRLIYRPYQTMTRFVLLLRLYPPLTERVIQMLSAYPALFQKLLSVNMRT